ncbi:MAG TPA: biopolymer transporter ExbD [Pirellulales bacterium]|nr:biopolymer transporter ExbD [Pirellulales bacterium]
MKIARKKMRVEIPNVAMGDIAFNLLIFFVILARAQDDSHLKWEAAASAHVEAADNAKVSVLVDKDNKLYLNGRNVGESSLAKEIESLLGAAPLGERIVLLKIHKETQAQRFEPIIEAVSEAGGDLVHVLEEKERTP